MNTAFDYIPWNSPVTEVSGVLVAGTAEHDLIPMGTGFLCAPFIALTARHVIDEIFQKFCKCGPTEAQGHLPFGFQFAPRHGNGVMKFDVMAYGYSPSIDICALILEPADELPGDFNWCLPEFEALPPSEGTAITGFGYPKSTHRLDGSGEAKIGLRPHETKGTVIEVHHERRDRMILPFPCFHTDARFDGGMSGGPVFNDEGKIVGLISTNMAPEAEGEKHSSYVSLIWPFLGLALEVTPGPPLARAPSYRLKELALSGEIQMLHHDYVVIGGEENDNVRFAKPE